MPYLPARCLAEAGVLLESGSVRQHARSTSSSADADFNKHFQVSHTGGESTHPLGAKSGPGVRPGVVEACAFKAITAQLKAAEEIPQACYVVLRSYTIPLQASSRVTSMQNPKP